MQAFARGQSCRSRASSTQSSIAAVRDTPRGAAVRGRACAGQIELALGSLAFLALDRLLDDPLLQDGRGPGRPLEQAARDRARARGGVLAGPGSVGAPGPF